MVIILLHDSHIISVHACSLYFLYFLKCSVFIKCSVIYGIQSLMMMMIVRMNKFVK